MTVKLGKVGARTLAGALVATGPALVACESGPTYDEWAATDGAAGRINLDDIQEAFKSSKSGTEFEQRVNEIYEGDNLVLIRVKQESDSTVVEGWEELNRNGVIDDAEDDLLFTIVEKDDKSYDMRGYGSNGYYHSGFGTGNFLFTYMLISAMTPRGGYYYYTPPTTSNYNRALSRRQSYRNGSGYRSQVSKNSSYFSRQKSFAGSRYSDAGRNLSKSRSSYQSAQKSSSAFKSSTTGVRSSWGSKSSGSSFGGAKSSGFRGGGGGQTIIGNIRSL